MFEHLRLSPMRANESTSLARTSSDKPSILSELIKLAGRFLFRVFKARSGLVWRSIAVREGVSVCV